MLRLDGAWVWDFWFADDGERHHVFYLQAPATPDDPDARHFSVSVGHAVSDDLVSWEVRADALRPRETPAFDDGTTWTGSVVRGDDGVWRMFYTGGSLAENCLVQRIGVATSDDLEHWHRAGTSALIEADPRWYETLDRTAWHDEAWRDPWVFRDPAGDGWHMLVTARAAVGPVDDRGVVGHAWSPDLDTWEVRPPLSEPRSGFGHLEVLQVQRLTTRTVVLFSCLAAHTSLASQRDPDRGGGVWVVEAGSTTGPFDVASARRVTDESRYSGRLVQRRDGSWVFMTFADVDAEGRFIGVIGDPEEVGWV